MRRLTNDLTSGRNVADNLPKYVIGMKDFYYRYALVRLALNYYTYYQVEVETENKRETHQDIRRAMNLIIRDSLLTDKQPVAEAIKLLDEYRKNILKEVNALTYYVDAFKIYEHALNRVEYRFGDADVENNSSDEDLCRKLMQYILSDEDNVVVNSKISEVLAELPIRLTKNKFFEYVSNGLSIYKGSQRQSLEDFIYMIKTTAMLSDKTGFAELFPGLEDTLQDFKSVDFVNLDEQEFKSLERTKEDVSAYIEDVMNVSIMLMDVMNSVYALMLSKEGAKEDKTAKACKEIIAAVNDYFILGSEMNEDIEDMFIMLEGTQEDSYSKINMYNITEELRNSYNDTIVELGLDVALKDLEKLSILSSDSIFVELDAVTDETIVDDKIVSQIEGELIDSFKTFFADNSKIVNRAVMSSVMSQLPVFFNNISELQDYIYNTLDACTDKAEKTACVEVLTKIMEE